MPNFTFLRQFPWEEFAPTHTHTHTDKLLSFIITVTINKWQLNSYTYNKGEKFVCVCVCPRANSSQGNCRRSVKFGTLVDYSIETKRTWGVWIFLKLFFHPTGGEKVGGNHFFRFEAIELFCNNFSHRGVIEKYSHDFFANRLLLAENWNFKIYFAFFSLKIS